MSAEALDQAAAQQLEPWRAAGLDRELRRVCVGPGACVEVDGVEAVSFASCDYLGLARHPRLVEASVEATRERGTSRGSARLLSGHDDGLEQLEASLARVFGAPSALVFGSGYLANVAVVTGLAGADDLIVSDVASHASTIDACRTSRAQVRVVDLCDDDALGAALADAGAFRRVLLLTLGVPSMGGPPRPLDRIAARADEVGAWVLVDDAHGLGCVGPGGTGSAAAHGVASRMALQVGNLGKALGSYGAFVLCGTETRELLLQTARPFVFTCALPPGVVAAAQAGVSLLGDDPARAARLQDRARALRQALTERGVPLGHAEDAHGPAERLSPIVTVPVGDPVLAVDLARRLLARGWFVPAVRPPTVPPGGSRLRLTASVDHTDAHLAGMAAAVQEELP